MKKILYALAILLFISGCGSSGGDDTQDTPNDDNKVETPTDTARTLSVSPLNSLSGVTVASSYLKFKDDSPQNEALLPYLKGSIDGNYIADVLEGSSISFSVEVPDDSTTYGSNAGKSIKYIATLYYPTTADSNYSTPQTLSGWEVPSEYSQMEESVDAAPIFADTTKKYPLIVYSHGIDGEVITNGRQLQALATHGYAVLGIFHGDDRFNAYGGEVYSPEEITLRPLSIKTAIDFLETSKYSSHIDFDKIGALGNSYGGTTSFILAGAKPVDVQSSTGGVLSSTVSDSRIKAAVGIEPFMGNNSGTFEEIMGQLVTFFGWASSGAATVTKPYLAITGTSDEVAVERHTKHALSKTPSNAHLVSMEGESHDMSNEGSITAGTWALHFLNYYLKDDNTFLSIKEVEGSPVDTYSSPY